MKDFGYQEDNTTAPLGDYHLWGRILFFCKNHWKLLSVAISLSLLITASTLGLPYLIQIAIDGYITNSDLDMTKRLSIANYILFLGSKNKKNASIGPF